MPKVLAGIFKFKENDIKKVHVEFVHLHNVFPMVYKKPSLLNSSEQPFLVLIKSRNVADVMCREEKFLQSLETPKSSRMSGIF